MKETTRRTATKKGAKKTKTAKPPAGSGEAKRRQKRSQSAAKQPSQSPASIAREVHRLARRAVSIADEFYRSKPDWLMFHREVFGANGIVDQMFPAEADLTAFKATAEYAKLREMADALRSAPPPESTQPQETLRVITVRLPCSLHENLRAEAKERETSMNQLCILKLNQSISSNPAASDDSPADAQR